MATGENGGNACSQTLLCFKKKPAAFDFKARRLFKKGRRVFFKARGLFFGQ